MRASAPRRIEEGDPLERFDCGNDVLNSWLITRALRNETVGDSRTYVTVDRDTGAVLGYYSLAARSVSRAEAGGGWLSRNAPDPMVILLGRLAVGLEAQGRGLGLDLLADALLRAEFGAETIGARALVAEAIDEEAGAFYERAGLWRSRVRKDLFAARLKPGR